MKKSISIVLLTVICTVLYGTKPCKQVQKDQGLKIEFIKKISDNRIDVKIDGKLFTSYCWPDNVFKSILYPLFTSAGTEINAYADDFAGKY